jgi:uncharacterized membrane protein (Fun14 family)
VKFKLHLAGSISDGYAALSDCNAWSDLSPLPASDLMQANSLDNQLSRIGGGAMFSSRALHAITQALKSLAKAVGYATLVVLQMAVSNAFTVFDLLAELLTKAINLGTKLKEQAIGIVNAMLGFMGRAVSKVQDVSINLLRWVLSTFVSELGNRALQAIQRAIQGSNKMR